MIIQLFVAALACISFSVLFHAPAKEYLFCGITGAIGWLAYLGMLHWIGSVTTACFIAAGVVTLVSRIFAVMRRVPVIVFLFAGIFPLVPGAGIYYTSYYLFQKDIAAAAQKGIETVGIAIAISFGIMMISLIPQKFFVPGRK